MNDGKLVATYSGRRTSAGAFTASSGVFIYNPLTNSWTDVSHTGMYYWTKDIVIDPNDVAQNTWYANVFSGWGGPPNGLGGLYKTTNRGTSWTKLSGSTIDRATSCTFNPLNANQIYLTTETQGLWISHNINSPSPTFSVVPSYPFQQPERVFFNPYVAGEIWVTSFGNGMKVGLLNANSIVNFSNENNFSIYPNPTNGVLNINMTSNDGIVAVYNLLGKEVVAAKAISYGHNTINVENLSEGTYFVKLIVNGSVSTRKVTISK